MIEYVVPALLALGFLLGIRFLQSPRTALWGNRLGALCMVLAVLLTFRAFGLFANPLAWSCVAVGAALGFGKAVWVRTIAMPQMVALLNGLGGAASALVIAAVIGEMHLHDSRLYWFLAALPLAVGALTFTGSMVAVLKLQGRLNPNVTKVRGYGTLISILLLSGVGFIFAAAVLRQPALLYIVAAFFSVYGLAMALRVGGADMPVLISFLNSLSGVAAAFSGLALNNVLVAGTGALVGVAGMILTQLMCRAMNRNLPAVLRGFMPAATAAGTSGALAEDTPAAEQNESEGVKPLTEADLEEVLGTARNALIVPGYGMAMAQAQQAVKDLMDALEAAGKPTRAAIHPVAGRMPGHMHVLLAEVGLDYDKLCDMAVINSEFPETDLVVAVGACDVINPAAATAEGTPLHGMPILRAPEAGHVIVCNLDERPGYSGVDNPLYHQPNVITLWGDAAETVPRLTAILKNAAPGAE